MKRLCLLIALMYVPAAGAAFKCVDEKGKTHIGDAIPEGCANVVVQEVSKSGTVIRKIDPPLTPAQLEQRKKEAEARKEADKIAAEQKRKDEALLQSFSSEREFDVVRDRQIEPLKGRITTSNDRVKSIEKRQQEIANEMEFYKAGKSKKGDAKPAPPPHVLVAENERLESEKQAAKKSVAAAEREIESLRAKFEADKKRWVTLKSAGASAAAAAGAGAPPAKK